jgi:hypothetical protein
MRWLVRIKRARDRRRIVVLHVENALSHGWEIYLLRRANQVQTMNIVARSSLYQPKLSGFVAAAVGGVPQLMTSDTLSSVKDKQPPVSRYYHVVSCCLGLTHHACNYSVLDMGCHRDGLCGV